MKRQQFQEQQKQQQQQQAIMQEQQQQYIQQRTERQITRQQITSQQRVQGEIVMQTTPTVPAFTGKPGDPSPPIFERIFKNARFAQGGNAIFEGCVRGNPRPSVSWTHKGVLLLESRKIRMSYDEKSGIVTLQINQIGPGDEGEYTCSAKNQYGEAICSVYIQPEGFGPPTQQLTDSHKKEFTQSFQTSEQKMQTGSQVFQQRSYQQTTDKRSYVNGTTTSVEDFKVDTFEYRLLRELEFRESITRRFAGESDLQISTTIDRTLGPVTPPQITQKPRNSKLVEGSDAVFTAKITGNPKPRLTWFKNGQRIRDSQRVETSYSNQQATLRIRVALPEDSGHYTLLSENPQGCTVSSAYLAIESSDQVDQVPYQAHQREFIKTQQVESTIESTDSSKVLPPNFVRTITDKEATEGKMTRFDCRVTGRPYPEVTWYINGQQVANDMTHKILVNESGNNSLMITNVNRADAGVVTCVARNKAGETSCQCNLNVIEKEQVVAPKFVERFVTTGVKEGEPVVFMARAVGTPIPRITWQKDGVPITPGPEIRISSDGSGASTLDIPCAKFSDAAWYQCTAQNVAGSTATRARLFVETPKGTTPEPRRLNLPRPTKIIEPEPAPGPEVIYLRHVERAKPYLPPAEEDKVYPPPCFIIPLKDVHQIEGGRIHFEARIEPVGDPTMRVEWYVNGRALDASSRATSVFRFGFISLDLISIVLQDSGEYLCRVVSSTGVAESRATLSVTPRATIEQASQYPDSLQYIQQLEDYSKYQRQESAEETSSQRPVFIRPLQDLGELQEGRNAHFEAQLTPVSDPTMKVEWYKDGKPITASSRITSIFNFGYVSLNIMHLRAEDAGSYTVRAVNRLGEAISSTTLRVFARTSVTTDLGIPEQLRYIEAAEELEAYQQAIHQKYVQEQPEPSSPPEFKSPIKDQSGIREGGFAHFEARLEPIGDADLRVEWLKDGRPVEASSRITTFFNFGYVALTIKYVTIHDVGVYTCRAYNRAGEAHTTAQLSVISKNDVIYDSQHPTGLQKIQSLEDSSRYSRQVQEETQITQAPRFLGNLKGTNKIVEGQRAHFEARVEPQSDLSMKIEWYHNGKPITAANRIQTYHDFGYVSIDILQVRSEDTGTYTVVARNARGEARLSATMTVETRSSVDTSSMHRGTYEKTQRLEESKFVEPQYHIEEISKSKPIFIQPLSDPKPVSEGKNIHLECRLEPMGDPTMRVEWFQNGRPVTVGSRFRTYYDFGFVALDIVHATVYDSGEYTVRATNHLGTAHTSACVRVIGRSDIVTETQNEQSLEQIQMLEDSSRYRKIQQEEVTVMQAPQFTRPLHNIETVELTNVHLECRLQPIGDATMKVDWFVNGRPVKTGHRFRPSYEFDYVALDILGVYPEDSGVYTCQARNQLGEAVTSCSVRVHAKKDLLLESQHPEGLERIQYLEDASRYKRHELVDEVVNVKPKFITKPKNQENLREGQHAHFECKLEPVTDPNLKVEWFKNGRPVTIGHRFRPIHDFGYVALDVIDLIAEDSGTYTCRAVNLVGSDEVLCTLTCRSSAQILTDTQNELGLEQIHYLEDKSKYHRQEVIEETTTQAPIFTTSLNNVEIKEGQRAHFECRLIPVSDATMKIEWFHNNKPVKAGSRFVETNSFGFVALDIMYAYPEDSGTYTCRAKNIIGEAITSATAIVHSKKSIYTETQSEETLQRLRSLEDTSRYQRKTATEEIITQAPVFTMPIKDLRVAENQAAHFEARVIPVGDPKLKVEWLRNGVPISASNRVTTMHDFGYVALNMKYVNPEDSGTYTCRAINELGEAVTSATLFVQSKAALQFESQHESALSKLQALEDTTKYQRREEEEILIKDKPSFTVQLNGPTSLVEGQSAHYECRIEPYPDPNMKVEWFHNGKPLSTGHRYRTTCDFGFASLDVLTVYAEDSGTYTCQATNKLGSARSSINLNVKSRASIIHDTQHESALKKIQYLEDDSRYKRVIEEDTIIAEKPTFGRPLKNIEHLPEGKSAHLEATLTPVNDPTMIVEWFRDGRPIPQGHKFKTTYDFGYVALDILYAYPEDSGTYMCKARNAAGEAVTTCVISVDSKQGLYLDTLDAQRLQKIRELETVEVKEEIEKEVIHQKPVFLTPLNNLDHLKEGEHAHLECRVEPINDPNLKIEWFVNGVAIKTGHRFRTTHDFGYVALDILYTYPEDSGTYMCKATNLAGEAVNTCTIKVSSRRSILLDTQHPDGLEKIRELEAQGHPARLEIEEPPVTPPRFVTELRGTTEVYEGQTAHFECQVEPLHDANLRIEFFHNGKPLPSAARFHVTFDFGYVALDIGHAVPEDAGQYSVRAINALGQCVSSIELKVIPRDSIIMDSQRPEGMDKIRELEAQQPWKRPDIPEPQTRQRPVFTQPLQNIDSIAEGHTAHFECRLIPVGDPMLKVEWFRNEVPLETSSRITKVHDFGYVSLDIAHVRDEDEGVYMCRASNPLGEAVTTASMKIKTKASIQLDTQHPEAQRRIAQLEAKEAGRPEEPEKIFDKPIFTQLLTGPTELWEGQMARYECRVVPVGDASLRFEWYMNGVELKMGSRFHVNHDFGYVTLDILKVIPEDSGVYTCKAINNAGEAISSISLKVKARSAISSDSIQTDAWQKIQLKEAEMNKVPEMFVDTTPQQAPVFTKHLESFDKLIEGQRVYLEAQVEPRADPNLRVEWFKNGVSLQTGTRLRSTFDFGLVTLSINGLRPDDSAIYTCKATNLLGEAVSTCSLKIADRHWLLGDTLHPDALPKIDALEQPQIISTEQPEPTYEEPVFITHLNNVECIEGDNAHFECNVEPSKDPTMKIEWFLNNKPLPTGARFKSTYDFGYVALDLTHAYEEDSGVITVKATNSKGSAQTSGTLKCTSKQNIYLQTQHPQGEIGLEKVKEAEDAYLSKYKKPEEAPEHEYPKPIWTVPLGPEFKLGESEPLHLEGQVEPKDDPNLRIDWYFNGKPLEHGSRFKMTSDFGFVTLDLTDVYERDSGIYTCKAYNKAGEAFTSTTIYCSTKENIIEKSQHPKGKEGLEAIQDLEESLKRQEGVPLGDEEGQPPMFTSQFENLTNLSEGEIAHFEASLIPTGDQTMVVEWFYNGKSLEASHRTRTVYAFGMVVLEVLGTKIEDSGTYTCRATNKWGKAEISVQLECIDKSKGQKPKFTTQIQSLEGLKDGQSAHFECTLIPVGDPHMKVEWFHNGKPLRHSSRFKMVSDFGFVVMDIAGVMSHDSGEYVCKASNKYGEDYTKATIKCFGKSGVYLDSLQPDSLARIRELESYTGEQVTTPTAPVAEPPKFITQIADITKLVEGQSAHFEARLTPVTDPDLKVEWYYNGKKLPHGHRYRTFHDFGIVILDILYCYEENSGIYECRAVNKYGEDSTRATLKCFSKANLVLESQLPKGMEGGLEKIQNLEDSMIRTKDEKIVEERGKAPMFTVPLSNIDGLREGESAHFEARVIPTDDPKLKVEWFWNGKPLRTGSRFRTFCDFGFAILEISPIYPEDSGEYSCRATNDYGEAVTTCTMKCTGKRSIILESQLPKGMESTIDKIAELEGLGAVSGQISPEDDTGRPPEFITTPSDLTLAENSLAHFECRLQPINDSSMRVEWFHNGKPLLAGSRVKTIHDFGFVILEVANCYQRDSGLYTCKATNRHGEATVSCKLQIRGRQGIILEPQLPSNFKTGTESIQKLEESLYKKDEILAEEETPNPPRFIVELKDIEVEEAGPSHFDCRVEPVGDPTMRIDWFHNGRPFATGSRVHQINDFGFISLDMSYTYARDSGEYVCRATNKWGTATTKATITCKSKKTIDFDSQLPMGMSGEKLKELERGPVSQAPAEEAPRQPPRFITQIQSTTVDEGEPVRFECRVEPKEDPNLRIEWYRNGKLIPAGHRYRTVYDMGFVSMDILYVYPEDSGEYVCKAINDLGEDNTRAAVSCKKLPSIILQNQVPKGMKKSEALMQMEATIKKYTSEIHLTEDDLYDADKKQPPRFVTQIQDQTDLIEMNSTKFECQLAPVGDPNMKVEWFFNGKPLPHKNRFTPIYDFGYVAMNFGWVYPEDSGEYLCRATNLYGMDETRAIIKTAGKPGIIYESQLPKGMKSIEKIREMEAAWQIVPEEEGEEEKVRSAPVFVSKPEPVTVEEGDWSRFCCRVTGHPRPRVMWVINGHTVVNGSRYKLTYDGMYHLDIPKTRQYDHGKVEVIARSSVGEAHTETTLTVKQRSDDYRGVLKNSPRRILGTKEYRKPEWVTQMEEMQEALRATQAVPRFIQEITDVYAKEGDIALFECVYSGNPKPDVVWYKNDKLIMNTENVKVRIFDEENRTTLTIKQTTREDDATYVCKATNEVGMIVTKAKLHIDTTSESRLMLDDTIKEEEKLDIKLKKQEEKPHKKKKTELKKAKEIKEKVKAERIKIEKEEIREEKLIPKEQIEEKRIVDVEETQLLETTEFIENKPEEVSRARRIVPIQEPIVTEATASLKKIDDQKPREHIPKFEERAKQTVEERESVVVSEITSEDIAPDFTIETKLDHAQVTSETLEKVSVSEAHIETSVQETKRIETKQKKVKKVKAEKIKEDITVKEIVERQRENIAREVDEIMEVLDAKEFGPGESPLRELATIGYLVRQGVSVNEINECLYRTEIFPALKTPDAQNALVQLVERKGHGPLITQVLTEETTTDESFVAATVGFRAFMRMVELQHATVEEVITHFAPEDFRPRAWEVTEISEVETEQHATERVDIVRKMEVHFMERRDERKATHVQDIREIKEEASLSITKEEEISEEVDELEYVVREGDTMYSICSYIAETEEAINLVEGEKVYIIDHTNQDWWFVKKHLTEEKGWVPAQYLLDEAHYTIYLQRKLHEKIDKLPIFEKPAPGEKGSAPRFIEKLQPIHTLDGYTVQFECQVEGTPRPQITWFRQTAIIKPSTDFQMYYDEDNVATLIIKEVFPEDAGTFTCVAKNAAGFASNTTELIVEAPLSDHGSDVTGLSRKSLSRESSLADILEGIPPTFSRKPKAKYVNEGDDVILECRLVAVPEPEITWYHKDAPVASQQNIVVATESDMHMYCSVVKFTKIQKRQEGRYKIIAKNREGEATIDIPVKVKTGKSEPPEILEPLKSHIVKEGETVVLSTQIVGNPSPKIIWYKDGKPIKGLQLKQDGHVNTLNLIQPQLADSGEYSVTAINDMGKAETRATLTVEINSISQININFQHCMNDKHVSFVKEVPSGAPEPPLFTKRFQEIIVPEKSTFKLVAKVTGNPVPEVTWLRNNKPLDKSANIIESYDGENIELEIKNANSEVDAGDYKCVASNPVGKASHGAKVTVDVAKVSFTRNLLNEIIVDEYKTLELSCETSHTVSTIWWHNDEEVSGMDHREVIQEGRLHKLLIKKSGLSDAGTYKCTVKNQMTSSNVIVRATKPEFVKKLQDFEVKERDVAILEVEITSQTADVTWQKDGELLTPSKGKLEFVKDGTVRKLFIRSASVHDEGEYTCALPDQECTAEVTVVELPPEIIIKMQDIIIARGEKATFDIELTKGDALVRWFKDGQELQFSEHVRLSIDGKRQKLKIYDTEVEDAGIYSCQVGDQTSSARLTVEEPEVDFIKKLPDVTLVPINTDATFLIELSRADVLVTWLRKSETIDCARSSKYNIIDEGNIKKLIVRKCTTEDIAEYTAIVANVKTSSRLKIEVIETSPRIYPDTLKKYKTMKGDDIDIVVKFTAKPIPIDEWTVNGRVLKKSKRIIPSIDECSAVLTIRDVQEKDFGDYNLKLTNPHGEDSIEINVIVVQVPGAPGIPEPLEITDNSITLHWKKPDSDGHSSIIEYILEYREKTETLWSKITETIIETTYKLTNLIAEKEYTFRVTAVNEAGSGEASPNTPYLRISKLSASEPPTILEALKSIVIGLEEIVTLSCVIGGVPTPRITWLKDDKTFEDNDITYENHVAKYTIWKTTETSSATFMVKAQNDAGMAETSCQLKIQESPKITCDENLRNQRLTVGDKWKVEIYFTGFPKPEVTWTINNKKIIDKRISIETRENKSIVTIPSLIRADTAAYTVKASNEAGSSSMECHLRVIDKPNKPQGPVIAKEIRQDRVTIEWQPPIDDGGVELERYTIEKCEANKKVWTKVGDVDKEVENFCAQKLQQDVDYLFRIIARNAVGPSEPLESEPIRTRTSFETPGPPRGPLQVFGMTKTSFTLKWESPENDGGTPIVEYIVEMKETSKKAWQRIASTKGEITNVTISDLKTDTSYNFRITAKNSVGTGPPYTAEEAITAGKRPKIIKLTENSIYALLGIFPSTKMIVVKTPPSCPLNVRATNVTSKSVTLNWLPPTTTGGSELTGYVIEKRPLIGKGARWTKVVTLDATTHQYCIENLKESEFLFRIFAENSLGLSIPTNSEPVTLKTHANVPSPPTAPLEMRQIAANTMVIEWGRPESDGGAPLEGYKIAIRDAKKTMWMEVGRVSADIQKLNIRDLQENHEYLVRIFARNEIGFSDHLESEEPFKIVPTSELSCVEPIAEAVDKGETASLSFSTENTSSWLREHNMDADIHSYARARLLRKDEYFFRIWHYAKKLFE